MLQIQKISGLLGLCLLAACAQKPEPKETLVFVLPPERDTIVLQNLKSRVLVYCNATNETSAEECAKHYEQQGYVRLTDIPKLPADKDFLKADTYPTRRWRKDERVPRW